MTDSAPDGDLVARLAAHKAIGNAPRAELEWLVAHGTLERYQDGDMIAHKGQPVEAMYFILSGHAAHMLGQAGAWRKAVDKSGFAAMLRAANIRAEGVPIE